MNQETIYWDEKKQAAYTKTESPLLKTRDSRNFGKWVRLIPVNENLDPQGFTPEYFEKLSERGEIYPVGHAELEILMARRESLKSLKASLRN